MKSLVISIFLLLTIVVFVLVYSSYMNSFTSDLSSLVKELPSEISENNFKAQEVQRCMDNITDKWEDNKIIIGMSLYRIKIEEIENEITVLKENLDNANNNDYLVSKSKLLKLIEQVNDYEKATLNNIL